MHIRVFFSKGSANEKGKYGLKTFKFYLIPVMIFLIVRMVLPIFLNMVMSPRLVLL